MTEVAQNLKYTESWAAALRKIWQKPPLEGRRDDGLGVAIIHCT